MVMVIMHLDLGLLEHEAADVLDELEQLLDLVHPAVEHQHLVHQASSPPIMNWCTFWASAMKSDGHAMLRVPRWSLRCR